MDTQELCQAIPMLLDEQLPGRYDEPLSLSDGEIWLVRPEGCLGAVLVREKWRPHVMIKAGVALHMPLSDELTYYVANNNRELWTGRMYLRSNPQEKMALVLLEDIVFGEPLDAAHPPGIQDLAWRIDWLMKLAGGVAQDMVGQFGGQPFGTDDFMFLDIEP